MAQNTKGKCLLSVVWSLNLQYLKKPIMNFNKYNNHKFCILLANTKYKHIYTNSCILHRIKNNKTLATRYFSMVERKKHVY